MLPARACAGRSWLLVLPAFVAGTAVWLAPLCLALLRSEDPQLHAYAHELLFRQTGTRYAHAWHHVKPAWYYLQVIATLWLPGCLLLPWLLPAWWRRLRRGDPRYVLLLAWSVLTFPALMLGRSAGLGFVWLVGLETDFGFLNLKQDRNQAFVSTAPGNPTFTVNQQVKTDWMWTVRPRVGYVNNNWMVYATGGAELRIRSATARAGRPRSSSGFSRTVSCALLALPPPATPATSCTAGSFSSTRRYASIFGCMIWNENPSSPRMNPRSCPVSCCGSTVFGIFTYIQTFTPTRPTNSAMTMARWPSAQPSARP